MNGGASVAPKVAFKMSGVKRQGLSAMTGGDDTIATVLRKRLPSGGRGGNRNAIVFACTRMQLVLATVCALSTVFVSVVSTYALTKERHANVDNPNSVTVAFVNDNFDIKAVHEASTVANRIAEDIGDASASAIDETSALNNTVLSNASAASGEPSAEELRLSEDLAPIWYNLSLKVYVPGFVPLSDAESLTFNANLTLRFIAHHSTKTIELNALKLNFPKEPSAIRLSDAHNSETKYSPKVIRITVNETLQKVFFALDNSLVANKEYIIKIPYSGRISKELSGLYITQYTTRAGQQRYAAVTYMEPTNARRMVPCFDEPAYKAVWTLSVMHPRGSRAVSNDLEHLENQLTDDENWLKTSFEPTLPMSSYLLALVVSEFEYVEGYTDKQTRFRIWAHSDALNFTSYALWAGIKVLEFYEDYYGIPFPLRKLDMMAFPDFAAGAMENWGLVIYKEKNLLYSDNLYSLEEKKNVAYAISHELAYQWFGNLVTIKWWSDVWLNQGFVTLMSYLGTDAISDGDFRMNEYLIFDSLAVALDLDASATSHPLSFAINRAEDVSEAFNEITNHKGASVLRMIQAVMGETYFKEGLKIYLNRYKYKNANHTNFWSTLTEAVPNTLRGADGKRFDVSEFAQLWTEQAGYPVVNVHHDGNAGIVLTQERFTLDQSTDENFGYKWSIPIWYNINGVEQPLIWLTNNSTTLTDIAPTDLVVVNSDSRGFYRVQYSSSMLERITRQLLDDHTQISVKSRARIIDDTFKLAEAGRVSYMAVFNLARYLSREHEYLPLETAFNGFSTLDEKLSTDNYKIYVNQTLVNFFEKQIPLMKNATFFTNDAELLENLLGLSIINEMCLLHDRYCISKVTELYRTMFAEPCMSKSYVDVTDADKAVTVQLMSSECSRVPVFLRLLTYCEGVHFGTENDFDAVMELYRCETVQIERERLINALMCSQHTHKLKELLALASDMNSTVIRLQDKRFVIDALSELDAISVSPID